MIATAKYSARGGPYRHALAILDLKHTDPGAVEFAINEGMEVPIVRNRSELKAEIERSDIVQVNWWQHPEMDEFLRSDLPAMRLIGWFHVSGNDAPQRITEALVRRCDLALGGSSYTYECEAFQSLPEAERIRHTGYVIGGAELTRVAGIRPLQHGGFNVGYIGTVNPVKMHKDYIALHTGINVPGLKVICCGGDRQVYLKQQAEQLGVGATFDFRGYVPEIAPVLAELDVYGYPLCPDTYAASELNLQEAMAAGIPPVVFPHGGLKTLVIDDYTGLVVRSAAEYRQAIEFLHQNPADRLRLGENARHFAAQMFGAERNAPRMNKYYERILAGPKTKRPWQSELPAPGGEPATYRTDYGSRIFIESLGGTRPEFLASLEGQKIEDLFCAESLIAQSSDLMCRAGILPYGGAYPNDPMLQLWGGLSLLGTGDYGEAATYFLRCHGMPLPSFGWRAFWYIALCGAASGDRELAKMALMKVKEFEPKFAQAEKLAKIIDSSDQPIAHITRLINPAGLA